MTTQPRSTLTKILTLLLIVGVAACGKTAFDEKAACAQITSADEQSEARRGIDATRNAYAAAWRAASVEQIASLYTEDAFVLYPNQPAVSGHAAIVDYFKGFFDEFPKNDFELISSEIVVTGPWAFDRGVYRWKGTPRNEPAVEDNGKYLVVLKRGDDGKWRVARDMDNSDRAAAQATRGAG
jgi:uncharacterized protein (TIGR02246 family)